MLGLGGEARVPADECVLERWRRRSHAFDGRPWSVSVLRDRPRPGRRAGGLRGGGAGVLRRPARARGAAEAGGAHARAAAAGFASARRSSTSGSKSRSRRRARRTPGSSSTISQRRVAAAARHRASVDVSEERCHARSVRQPPRDSPGVADPVGLPCGSTARSSRCAGRRWPSAPPASCYKLPLWIRGSCRRFATWSSGARSRRRPSGSASPSRRSACRCARSRSASARSSSTARAGASSRPRRGSRLYRGAQRLLALEEEIVSDLADEADGRAAVAPSRSAPRPGPAASSCSQLLCEFAAEHSRAPRRPQRLRHADRSSIASPTGRFELGVVGAAPRHRGVEYEPFFRDTVDARVPARPSFRRPHRISVDDLRGETLIVMQEGAGVRADDRGRAPRASAFASATSDVRLELGLQESVTSAVRGGYGVTLHLAHVDRDRSGCRHACGGTRRSGSSSSARSGSFALPGARRHAPPARFSSSLASRLV